MASLGRTDNVKSFLLCYAAFNVLAFLGNFFSLPLFFGVDFIFGSIATIMVIKIWDNKLGAVTALLASSYTYFLWGHPYAIIIFVAEAIIVGRLHSRKYNLVIADTLYWLVVGTPLICIFYKWVLGMDWLSTVLIILKQTSNGIFNTLVASLFISHITPLKRLTDSRSNGTISLQQVLFNTISLLIIVSAIFFMVYEGRSSFNKINEEIDHVLNNTSYQISEAIRAWFAQQYIPISQLAGYLSQNEETPEQIQKQLKIIKESFPSFHNIYVADKEGTTIAFYPERNEKGDPTIGLNFSDRLYYKKLRDEMKPYISDLFIGRGGTNSPITIVAVPIVKNNEFNGYVLGALDLQVIKKLISLTVYHDKVEATLIDRNNMIIASTGNQFNTMDRYNKINSVERAEERLRIGPGEEALPEMTKWKNSSYIQITLLNDMLPWRLVVESPLEYCQKRLYAIYVKILACALTGVLLGIIAACYISRRVTAPLKELTATTGTLAHQVSSNIRKRETHHIQSDITEVACLTNNFRLMEQQLIKAFHELKLRQKTLEYLAYYDQLTGLPNRVFIKKQFRKAPSCSQKLLERYVMLIDIDNFKKINEGFGQDIADALLKDAALRIDHTCGKKGMVARYGEDEFVSIIDEVESKKEIERLARCIIEEVARPFYIHGINIHITVSIGISAYPGDGDTFNTLLKYAAVALHNAKKGGKNNYRFFSMDMLEPILKNLQVEKGLRKAVENEEFLLYYQPQVEISTGKIIGAEALIRWDHPQFGIVSPEVFIAVAEETGLIVTMGEWVVKSVCQQINLWRDMGLNIVPVSINISVLQFLHGNVADFIIKTLEEYKISPKHLRVEITESLGIDNMETVIRELVKLNEYGISIILDDFGKGYSSLTYLQRLPISYIKIDKIFIDNISNRYNRSIIKIIIDVAHSLNLKVVAEGVETEEQLDFLKGCKCDEIQGYMVSKPLPVDKFQEKYLQ